MKWGYDDILTREVEVEKISGLSIMSRWLAKWQLRSPVISAVGHGLTIPIDLAADVRQLPHQRPK